MSSIFGMETGISMPSFTANFFGGTLNLILWVLIISGILGFGLWWWMDRIVFNIKIVHFENIAGQGYQPTFKDRARLVKVGDGGEELLYLKKKKVYRSAYGRKMGKNTFWFAKGQDGYWYNCILGDLDAKMGMLDIEPIDRDMRLMHVAIRKNITERYRKIGFMEKYGVLVVSIIGVVIIFGGLWFLIDQIGELINQASATVKASGEVIKPLEKLISKMDSMYSGGSGISSAG